VVTVYEVGEEQGFYFIAMEYVADSLAEALKNKGRLDYRIVIDIVSQVADGLHAAHLMDLIHQDIKPSNILLTENGKPKLSDFGLARRGSGRIGRWFD